MAIATLSYFLIALDLQCRAKTMIFFRISSIFCSMMNRFFKSLYFSETLKISKYFCSIFSRVWSLRSQNGTSEVVVWSELVAFTLEKSSFLNDWIFSSYFVDKFWSYIYLRRFMNSELYFWIRDKNSGSSSSLL